MKKQKTYGSLLLQNIRMAVRSMIITNVEGLRDPFVFLDNGIYYLYGTGVTQGDWDNTVWDCYVNTSGELNGKWIRTEKLVYEKPAYGQKQFWAPEVHTYKGLYYMFASYYSSQTQHRGSTVLSAPTPTGPFVEISSGHITPHDQDCIDATLYVDSTGQPWLIFVHEWTCTDDGIGRMAAAKLSDDLTHLISEPVELFRADSPAWTNDRVTDGCFMHTLRNGKRIMLWSNFEENGYCIGIAHNVSGGVTGVWEQETTPLYKRGDIDAHDGGHGMIFTDIDGTQYICCHSPNNPCKECRERTVFLPIQEENGTLRLK